MSYAKFDDLYDDKLKIKRAWKAHPPNPVGLHAMAITYCQRHRLDGKVPDDWLREMLPNKTHRAKVLMTMVDCVLFDPEPHEYGKFVVHDFLDWNESSDERDSRSRKAASAAEHRWRNADRNAKRNTPSAAIRSAATLLRS